MKKRAVLTDLEEAKKLAIKINQAMGCPILEDNGYKMDNWVDPNNLEPDDKAGYMIEYPENRKNSQTDKALSDAKSKYTEVSAEQVRRNKARGTD